MKKILLGCIMVVSITACDDKDPIIEPDKTSPGSQLTLDGNVGEQTGASAGNSIFVDFSSDKVSSLLRQSWDLGFYNGDQFSVIINNTTAAMAYVTDKNDLNSVNSDDTIGVTMVLSLAELSPALFDRFDGMDGDLSKTVIPAISANDAMNKVIILNRGTAGAVNPRDYYKIRILRNGTNGYTIQYAKLNETTFKTAQINKDSDFHFHLFSLDNESIQRVPLKDEWDIQWTLSIYETNFSTTEKVPYAFSDLVMLNHLSGVKAAVKSYETIEEANAAFENYSKNDLSNETWSSDRWTIGSSWRITSAPGSTSTIGTVKTKFYIVQDPIGNAYKLKFLSFITDDGGVRGRPEIKYELIK